MVSRFLMLSFVLAAALPAAEADFLKHTRQLTLDGRRAGEGYFSADGKKLIFQSERDPANPFYQIFLMDLETGDTSRVSPGTGKTTCAWIHPGGKKVMFASTHEDAEAKSKQEAELQQRAEGKMKRYSWDYDEHFDLFESALDGSGLKRLTDSVGYDAEGSFSPDGSRIAFASNRQAYAAPLSPEDAKRLETDKQYFMEIYTMKSDGTDVRRLTTAPGYDGGPFFSADGKKICWRRFNETGEKAEIWTMNADGTDQRQSTRLGAMSWAPFFHPTGQYLIFATNLQGFDNFELYMVDAEGTHEPVRVTDTPGFDGLPCFSPEGTRLTWTSTRTEDKTSQIFLADWDHARAAAALGLKPGSPTPDGRKVSIVDGLAAEIAPGDLKQHITLLASDEFEGRLPGTKGERLATQYAADVFAALGLDPAGDDSGYFQAFDFTAGVELGPKNQLTSNARSLTVSKDWSPLSFSTTGETAACPVVFAGYGLELAAEGTDKEPYSSYFHLEVKDKWVMVLRYFPEGVTPEQRTKFLQPSSLRYKALTARQHGAKGIIIVSGPNSKVREQLVPLTFDASLAGSGLAAISITDAVADSLLSGSGKSLKTLQDELDTGQSVPGFELKDTTLAAIIDLKQEQRTGRNVLGVLRADRRVGLPSAVSTPLRLQPAEKAKTGRLEGDPTGRRLEGDTTPSLLIGAHIDHLGREHGGNSRATEEEKGQIHHGADDNASGTAGVFEIAQWMAAEKAAGRLALKRDVIFAAWSGEEAGLLGSTAYAKVLAKRTKGEEAAHLGDQLVAVLNMDMIGRLSKTVVLQGLGSSDWWRPEIEKRNIPVGLPLTLQSDCYLPTDTTTFYPKGVPILNAFTGSHEDYHRPTDTADKLNYDGAARITRLMALIARDLAAGETVPVWKEYKSSAQQGQRTAMRVYLGTIPDYSQGDIAGVKLSGVSPVGPAAKAGVRGGDVIVSLGGKAILNIYDYTAILGELKVDQETEIIVLRGDKKETLKLVPTSRD